MADSAGQHGTGRARPRPALLQRYTGPPPVLHHVDPAVGATQASSNWSGYVVSSSGGDTSVSGTWTVPAVSTQYDGMSATWVGIDGDGNGYLIQTGTSQNVTNGQASYGAWWEVITPTDVLPEQNFSDFPVSPGDSITGTVSKGSSGEWTTTLVNNTTGETASKQIGYAGPGDSAEWIQEVTDDNGYAQPAPDWGTVMFTDVSMNGANPELTSSDAMDIVDGSGLQEDSTSSPNATRNGFSVTWLANGSPTKLG